MQIPPDLFSITTDYVTSYGSPQPYLQRIAEAGFTHIHWCHHWDTDFLYTEPEIAQIQRWLREYHLQTLNLHASAGREKSWESELEYARLAGVELVRNRLRMAARLGADVIVLHASTPANLEYQRRSLSQWEAEARFLGIRIALENSGKKGIRFLDQLFSEFPPDYLGLCYDTGHGNMNGNALDILDRYRDRLIAVHIHDNDGRDDLHKLPFTGTVDWDRFMNILSNSVYNKPLNLEVIKTNHPEMNEDQFLRAAYQAGERLMTLVSG